MVFTITHKSRGGYGYHRQLAHIALKTTWSRTLPSLYYSTAPRRLERDRTDSGRSHVRISIEERQRR